MHTTDLVLLLLPALLVAAAMADLFTMTIPNWLTGAIIGLFPVLALGSGLSGHDVLLHLAAGGIALLIGFALFATNGFGGGDAKLAAGIALWLGPSNVFEWTLLAAVFGGILTVILLAGRQLPLPLTLINELWIERLHHPRTGVPYGIALAAAALLVYPHSPMFFHIAG